MIPHSRAYVGPMGEGVAEIQATLEEAFKWLNVEQLVPSDARVFLKPNLTWKVPILGATTTPAFIEGVVRAMKRFTNNITIGEADGGYHSFKCEEAFQSHGIYRLRDELGVQVVSLSSTPREFQTVEIAGSEVTVELPSILLHDVDVFITLPVPKVHVITRVSLGFKNQWGCQPGTMRLRNHPQFVPKVLAINKLLNPRLALYDGSYFLDRSGPMKGDPVKMDLLIAADDVGVGDLTCCEIMGISPERSKHLRMAMREGMMPSSLTQVELNAPINRFQVRKFTLQRSPINWIALAGFRSALATRLLYDSRVADILHWVLYKIRRNRLVGRFLYGSIGPPES